MCWRDLSRRNEVETEAFSEAEMLRLTSLAPDIVEAILRGHEPDGISLENLRKNLPVSWQE